MKLKLKIGFCFACICWVHHACGQQKYEVKTPILQTEIQSKINDNGTTIDTRFETPKGYTRIHADTTSFASYLRNLPLKPKDALVRYYNGSIKNNHNVYEGVIDLPIGNRDLHQCADAVMRLRADYLFSTKKYDSIHFNFTNGFEADYTNWRKGKRISVKGNQVSWKPSALPSDSPKTFWKYLEMVFAYAGTASLSKELKAVPLQEMRIGDIFIQGGFPGHAVIVVDMAIDTKTKEKIFLLAQSFMPAQEIQLLKNPNNLNLSPWYSTTITHQLRTPEWTFDTTDLKRFY